MQIGDGSHDLRSFAPLTSLILIFKMVLTFCAMLWLYDLKINEEIIPILNLRFCFVLFNIQD